MIPGCACAHADMPSVYATYKFVHRHMGHARGYILSRLLSQGIEW